MNPAYKRFLDLIAWSEGTSRSPLTQNNGYDVIVTGVNGPSVFTDYSNHPFVSGGAVLVRAEPPAPPLYSTAAGRYQVLARYWRIYKLILMLPDFGPDSQDAVAIQQMKEKGALPLIDAGDIQGAIEKCANLWASLPGNSYGQGGNSMEALLEKYAAISTSGQQSA